jgi:hypothetical protein
MQSIWLGEIAITISPKLDRPVDKSELLNFEGLKEENSGRSGRPAD